MNYKNHSSTCHKSATVSAIVADGICCLDVKIGKTRPILSVRHKLYGSRYTLGAGYVFIPYVPIYTSNFFTDNSAAPQVTTTATHTGSNINIPTNSATNSTTNSTTYIRYANSNLNGNYFSTQTIKLADLTISELPHTSPPPYEISMVNVHHLDGTTVSDGMQTLYRYI